MIKTVMCVMDENQWIGHSNLRVYLGRKVITVLEAHKQLEKWSKESFGVLVGSRSLDGKSFWIEDCSSPATNDVSSRTSFTLKDPHHQEMVNIQYESSSGLVGYIGTWHTHPQRTPQPSNLDIDDWAMCELKNQDRTLFFVIVGTEKTSVFQMVDGEAFELSKREFL